MKTITLEASLQNNRKIEICIKDPSKPANRYEPVLVEMNAIDYQCKELIQILNHKSKDRNSAEESKKKVQRAGKILCDALFSENIKQTLRNTDAEYLIIDIDDGLVQIPWELIYLDQNFLCERFIPGRTVKVKNQVKDNHRNHKTPLNMWVIANPQKNLTGAAQEAEKIEEIIDFHNYSVEPTIKLERHAVKKSDIIKKSLKEYDIIHFAGHADYNEKNPSESCWKLFDDNFTAKDIGDIDDDTYMPLLIFSNACQSARSESWRNDETNKTSFFDMAHSFISSGVRHYIGTFWNIPDMKGKDFAHYFYQSLLDGKTIGKSIKLARTKMNQSTQSDISWASYLLYGDPTTTYFRGNNNDKEPPNVPPEISPSPIGPRLNKPKHFWGGFLLILICLFGIFYYNNTDNNPIDKDLLAMYLEAEDKEQKDIERLIKQINDNVSNNKSNNNEGFHQANPINNNNLDHTTDNWTSRQTTLSIMTGDSFKSFVYNDGIDEFVASAMESAIQKYPGITLIDRREIHDLLKELNISSGPLVKSKKRIEPDFFPANYLLNLSVRLKNDQLIVSSRLRNTQNSQFDVSFDTLLDHQKNIFDQKDKFEELVLKLMKKFPVRGKISQISDKGIHLNIGYAEGVRKNQRYEIIEVNSILSVVSTENHTSIGIINDDKTQLQTGLKVILLNEHRKDI